MIKDIIDIYIERSSFFLRLTYEHILISGASFLIAAILGLTIGLLISQFRKSSPYVLGLINIVYTIPSIALFGFLIPLSGIGDTTAVIALSIYALLPMVRNTYLGIKGIDPYVLEAAIAMGSTKWQILTKIKIPLAFPVILGGLRTMLVMTIALAGIAAFIGAGGLGVAIYRGITTNNMNITIAGSILIAILALLSDWLIGLYEKRILRKRHILKK